MSKRKSTLLTHLKDWWWLYGVAVALIGFGGAWSVLTYKVQAIEQNDKTQNEELQTLVKIQQYWQGVYDAQQRAPMPPSPRPRGVEPSASSGIERTCYTNQGEEKPCR